MTGAGQALGYPGIIQGISEDSTFISRSPFGSQVELEAEDADGSRYPLGIALPGPGTYTVHIRVSHAHRGWMQLIAYDDTMGAMLRRATLGLSRRLSLCRRSERRGKRANCQPSWNAL